MPFVDDGLATFSLGLLNRPRNAIPSILSRMESGEKLSFVAPMVRYSKLPFRLLCLEWGADACYSPMIIAESFVQSTKARDNEFTTSSCDMPLVAQFAARDTEWFGEAARICSDWCGGIDLNCGCPQKWAINDGIGSALLSQPELIAEMVKTAKRRSSCPISIKIRVEDDIRETVELCRRAEMSGVSWIAVHGRTMRMKSSEPPLLDHLTQVKQSCRVPVIVNGTISSPSDIGKTYEKTGCDGIMSARAVLGNPAIFKGYEQVPQECLEDFVNISLLVGTCYVGAVVG
mmetsp:Transcript_45239/g.117094  ORF Transcript_45239/g.117094 Transcript_45239/m.117094 type:complete len:288 (-) Transcript_45239:207-1070(-)